jgi:hypothetical protein
MTVGANYAFFSVLRRGLAALIPAGATSPDPRLDVPVSLSASGTPVSAPALALRGPGDVAGFDTSSVRRTWPTAGAVDAESNYFPLLELSDADLPWRYSPLGTSGDRLQPWFCLVALESSEVQSQLTATSGRPLGAVTVASSDSLPDLNQAWAWAHAQVVVAQDPAPADYDATSIDAILTQAPSQATARLLCPRQLQPQASYQVFLVPTFERGRLAGLGEPTTGVDRLAPAWQPGQTSVALPVYYNWGFQTGEAGDFQSLVMKLKPIANIPDAVWERELAVTPPGADPPSWQVVELQSALLPLVTPAPTGPGAPVGPPAPAAIPEWQSIDEHGFTAALGTRTDAGGTTLDPPLYGRWLAAANKLLGDTPPAPPWFRQLNADPRVRVAAGLGTVVVQTEQQQLLAGAWAQVAGIRAANERLRLSQLARELALRLYARHLTALDPQSVVQVSSPVHGRVLTGGATVAAQLAASPIVPGALAPAWRRTTRPLGTLAVRQGRAASPAPSAAGVLARLNNGALSVVPAQAAPPAGAAGAAARLGNLAQVFANASVQPAAIAHVHPPSGFRVMTFATAAAPGGPAVPPVAEAPHAAAAAPAGAAPAGPAFHHPVPLPVGPPVFVAPPTKPVPEGNDAFIQAAAALMGQLGQAATAGTSWVEADLDAATSAIQTTLDPLLTIQQPLVAQLSGVDAGPRRTDPLEPVMAAPAFPQPMYAPLASVGREWLLPGLDQMDPNTIALFATNWKFVEAYLVGLNHELARKLLWNGYPTDQRGSYFRRFWDIQGSDDGSGGEVGPIHLWTNQLGHNQQLATDPLILLVRGDLIRRYPNVVVYATDVVETGTVREPGPNETAPIFFALIEPDVALFGFDLDPAAARGDPGTFFVLQEHPSEPRFGLEPAGSAYGGRAANWSKLGWDALAASADALAALTYIDLTTSLPLDPTTPDDKGAVWHANGTPPSRAADLAHLTLREPFRLAVHASLLIPDPTAPPTPTPSPGGGA